MNYTETTNVHHSFATSPLLPNSEVHLTSLLSQLTKTTRSVESLTRAVEKAIRVVSVGVVAWLVCKGIAVVIDSVKGNSVNKGGGGDGRK